MNNDPIITVLVQKLQLLRNRHEKYVQRLDKYQKKAIKTNTKLIDIDTQIYETESRYYSLIYPKAKALNIVRGWITRLECLEQRRPFYPVDYHEYIFINPDTEKEVKFIVDHQTQNDDAKPTKTEHECLISLGIKIYYASAKS